MKITPLQNEIPFSAQCYNVVLTGAQLAAIRCFVGTVCGGSTEFRQITDSIYQSLVQNFTFSSNDGLAFSIPTINSAKLTNFIEKTDKIKWRI
jgi:hypothetical protein